MQKLLISLGLFMLLIENSFSQVNVQQGAAQFSLPIYNFSDGKSGLSHNVSISYFSGNGLRVIDLPGAMGQGWSLIAGGSIIRKQNGEPDDQNSTIAFPPRPLVNTWGYNHGIGLMADHPSYPVVCTPEQYVNNYYPNGFLYSEFPLDLTDEWPLKLAAPKESAFTPRFRQNMDKRWKSSRRTLTDRQQDIFIFNLNGRSGEFVISKSGEIVTIGDSKLKIEKFESDMTASHIRTRIYEFKITDEAGLIYRFNALSLSEVLKPKEVSNSGGDFSFSVTDEDVTGEYTVDKWGLTEITNPFSNEKILFNYIDNWLDFEAQQIPTYQFMETANKQNVNLHKLRSKGNLKLLKSVIFPEGHMVEINYNFYRQDILNESPSPIVDVSIKYNNTLVTKYVFNYGYFLKKEVKNFTDIINAPDKRFLRLCLKSVQKQGLNGTLEPPYEFTYYTGSESADPNDIVPPTNCFATDHWGYYNKSSLVDINIAIPAKETFKALMVNSSLYRNAMQGTAKFGLLKSIKNPTGGEIVYEYSQNIENIILGGGQSTINIGGVHVSSLKLYDGINHANDIVTSYSYINADGSPSAWGYEAPIYNIYREMKFVNWPYHYDYGGVLISDRTATMAQAIITSIVKKLIQTAFGNSVFGYLYAYVAGKFIEAIFLYMNPYVYDHDNSYQFYPMNYNNPIGTHFSRVVQSNSSVTGGIGKIVQEFSKPLNIATEILNNIFPYSQKQRYAAWEFDLLKRSAVYDNTDLLDETIYNYNPPVKNSLNTNAFKSCKVEPNHLFSSHCEDGMNLIPVSNWSSDFYYPLTGRSELSYTTQKTYSTSAVLSERTTSVQYNTDFLPNVSTSVKSNGDQIITKTYYSNDYNSAVSLAIQLLKTKNAIAVPVATEKWLKKAVTNEEFLVEASINEFVVLPNNDVKIGKVYALENKEPIAKSIIQDWNGNTLVRNTNYFKVQQEFAYNTDGNLVQTTTNGGEISSQIFDYNKRLVIASISNAAPADVAYTSFESDNMGGWSFCCNQLVVSGISGTPTGEKCFSMPYTPIGGGWISSNLSINKNYILSFWMKNGGSGPFVIGSANLSKSVSINDWTYYEYKIDQGSASPSISGQGYIDELRLYPDNAKMATVTYDPARGKTSECDINNRILYYEYDGLGRVSKVRDEKQNVIKTYEYHFKN